jgi:hypothetical protein
LRQLGPTPWRTLKQSLRRHALEWTKKRPGYSGESNGPSKDETRTKLLNVSIVAKWDTTEMNVPQRKIMRKITNIENKGSVRAKKER